MTSRREYEINVLGYRIKFTDREEEVEALTRLVESGSPLVEFVYGPEGCGKSTLLRYVAWLLSGRKDVTTIYVDALEHDTHRAILGVDLPRQELTELARAVAGPLGAALALSLSRIVELTASKLKLTDKILALFVDDPIKALGVDKAEAYVKWLYELIYKIAGEYNVKKVLVLATTSEGMSRKRLARHTYLHITLLWNLPYHGFTSLLKTTPQPPTKPRKTMEANRRQPTSTNRPRPPLQMGHNQVDQRPEIQARRDSKRDKAQEASQAARRSPRGPRHTLAQPRSQRTRRNT